MSTLFKSFVIFYIGLFFAYASNVSIINVYDSKVLIDSNKAFVIDVRELDETKFGIVKNALVLPLSLMTNNRADFDRKVMSIPKGKSVIVYCASGRRASIVGAELEKMGFKVFNMEKFKNWTEAGYPVEQFTSKEKI